MYFLHLFLSPVILIDSFTGSLVHVLMLSIQAVHGLPRLHNVNSIIDFSMTSNDFCFWGKFRLFNDFYCISERMKYGTTSPGFPLFGKSRNVMEFCFSQNVRELSGNFDIC